VRIRAGYDIAFQCAQEMPMVLMLTVHPGRQADLLTEHRVVLSEGVHSRNYHDLFGNVCTRLVAPAGLLEIRNEFVIEDSGLPDLVAPALNNSRFTTCLMRRWSTLWGAVIATRKSYPTWRGRCLAAQQVGTGACRQSATTCTGMSSSVISTLGLIGRRLKAGLNDEVFVAISHTWRSRCAVA